MRRTLKVASLFLAISSFMSLAGIAQPVSSAQSAMAQFIYKRAYHRPLPGVQPIYLTGMSRIPVFVDETPFLSKADFVSAVYKVVDGRAVVEIAVTETARTKLSVIGEQNASAQRLQDFVGLLLFIDGEPAATLTMVWESLADHTLHVRDLTEEQARQLASLLSKP
jgi:hypothetical protein